VTSNDTYNVINVSWMISNFDIIVRNLQRYDVDCNCNSSGYHSLEEVWPCTVVVSITCNYLSY